MSEHDDRQRVEERWGDPDFKAGLATSHWMASETVQVYLNWLATGQGDCDWLNHLLSRWVEPKPSRVLVLGCGDGWLERSIAPAEWIARIDAFDVSHDVVSVAAESARGAGLDKIHYGVKDLNVEGFGSEQFDVVIAHSVLHHVENLEFLFTELQRVLADDGVLVVNEYVGPNRFQFTDQQLEIENSMLSLLPDRFRRGHLRPGLWNEKPRPTIEEMIRIDPSEAVRSDEIVGLLNRHFVVLESRAYGGTILHDLLYDLVPNFSHDAPAERALIVAMCLAEATLIRRQVLDSDFVVMAVAKTQKNVRAPGTEERALEKEGAIVWSPVSRLSSMLWGRRRSTLDRPWLNHPQGRRAENLLATGDADCDWVEHAIALAGEPCRVAVAGRDVSSVSRRLEQLGVDIEQQSECDLLIGSHLFANGAAPVRERLASGGLAVSVEGLRSGSELPTWSEEFAETLFGLLPDEWKGTSSPRQMLREGLVTNDGETSQATLVRELEVEGFEVTIRPLSSLWISRLFSRMPLHRLSDDECASTLMSLLVWFDGAFSSFGLLPARRALIIARAPQTHERPKS